MKKRDIKSIISQSTTLSTISSFLTRNKLRAVDKDQLAFINCPIIIKSKDDSLSQVMEYKSSTSSLLPTINSDRKTNGDVTNNIKEFFNTEINYIAKLNKLITIIQTCVNQFYDSEGVMSNNVSYITKVEIIAWSKMLSCLKEIHCNHKLAIQDYEYTLDCIRLFIDRIMNCRDSYKRFFQDFSSKSNQKFMHIYLKDMENSLNINAMYFDELMTEPYTRLMRYPLMIHSMMNVTTDNVLLDALHSELKLFVSLMESSFSRHEDIKSYLELMSIITVNRYNEDIESASNEVYGISPILKVPIIDNKLAVSLDEYKSTNTLVILKTGLMLLDCRVKESYVSDIQAGLDMLKRKRTVKLVGYARYDKCSLSFNNDYRLMSLNIGNTTEYYQFPLNYSLEFREVQKGFYATLKHKYDLQGIEYFDNIFTCYTTNKNAPGDVYYTNKESDKPGIIITKLSENRYSIYKNGNIAGAKEGGLSRLTEVLRANCSINKAMPDPMLKRNSTINMTLFGKARANKMDTLQRQKEYRDLRELTFDVKIDQDYILLLLRIVIKHYKVINLSFNQHKISQLKMRLNRKQSENSLLKDTSIHDLCEAIRLFMLDNPELKFTNSDSSYAINVSTTRQLWQIMPSEIFDEWILPFWGLSLTDLKIAMKKGGRLDSRYL